MPKCRGHAQAFEKPRINWRHKKAIQSEMSTASAALKNLITPVLKDAIDRYGGGAQTYTQLRNYAAKANTGQLSQCRSEPHCEVCDSKRTGGQHHCLCSRRKRASANQKEAREEIKIELTAMDRKAGGTGLWLLGTRPHGKGAARAFDSDGPARLPAHHVPGCVRETPAATVNALDLLRPPPSGNLLSRLFFL